MRSDNRWHFWQMQAMAAVTLELVTQVVLVSAWWQAMILALCAWATSCEAVWHYAHWREQGRKDRRSVELLEQMLRHPSTWKDL